MIEVSIAPFFSLPPGEVRARIDLLEKTSKSHAFVRVKNGTVSFDGARWRDILPEAFIRESEEFLKLLPDMVIPIFLHDGPMVWFDADAKRAYLQAAKSGVCECPTHSTDTLVLTK